VVEVDWFLEVITLRDRVEKLKVQFPAEALTVCRKAMEVIQYSLFHERFGEIPESHIMYSKMMGPSYIGEMVSKTAKIEFNTIVEWGNYGSHFQIEEEPTENHVEKALDSLDNLTEWRFEGRKALIKRLKSNPIVEPIDTVKEEEDRIVGQIVFRAIQLSTQKNGWAPAIKVGLMLRKLNSEFNLQSSTGMGLEDYIKSKPTIFATRWTSIKGHAHGGIYEYQILEWNK
jgi:hypothetical protein